ncbi:MAG: hypothetical protein ACLQU1_21535 [Bryobacteraceae bacterium]
MPEKSERLFDHFLRAAAGATIWEAVRFCFGVVFAASVTVLLSQWLTAVWGVLAPHRLLIAVVALSGGAWVYAYGYQKLSRFHPRFSRLDCDFRVVEKEIVFEYRDRTHITYRKRLLLKALRNGLDEYHDKYHWTGRGIVSMKSAIQEQEVHETFRKNVWQLYEIRFQKTLAKDEEIETEVIWELNDSDRKAVPFFSATIDEPTDLLKMKLSIPSDMGLREAVGEVSSSIVTKKALSSKTLPFDRNGMVIWEIRKPQLFHHYEVKWVLPGETRAEHA